MEIRLLTKNRLENRLIIAKVGAVKPLILLISSSNSQLQEYGVTIILNLSLCDENKGLIASSGVVKPLARALKTGTSSAKENTACENKIRVVQAGIMKPLVELMVDFGSNMVDKSVFVLSMMVTVPKAKTAVVKEGAIPILFSMPESLNTMGIAKEVDDLKGNMVSLSSSMASKDIVSFSAKTKIYEVGVVGDARVRMRSKQRSV
ncbi:hypothetical protein SADUNF_Sadunf17G0066200 [Salix dunnii]|uniref:Uncharacterized protein n=1 Tax=Salix dunnii TaxID=1413687 RepID=A0A835J7Q7_9ROSI|nr:hypothetical protein SADUNF_Sadunf17G0066200 [Salix dunnii]